jgi:hypothetical protein
MINYDMRDGINRRICNQCKPSRTIPEHFNYWTPENPSNDFPVMNYLVAQVHAAGFSGLTYVDGHSLKSRISLLVTIYLQV